LAKENRNGKSAKPKERLSKKKPAVQMTRETPAAGPSMLPAELTGSMDGDLIHFQADYLGNPGISIQRRQAAASAIGRLAGNRYLQQVAIQMEDDDTQAKDGKKPKAVKKKMIDKAKSVGILEKAYGGYKTMTGGKVEVLGQADFEKAWEKIYAGTKYAWATYVIPGS
jgi:hypothetical protein